MSKNTYVAIAYRFGNRNGGWCIVCAGADEHAVCNEAQAECQNCAGKYGVGVYRFPDHEPVAYFPSAYGETEPQRNQRIYCEHELGWRVLSAIEERDDVPEWLKEIHDLCEKVADIFARAGGQQ